jgi:hypothetical protein
MRGRRNRDEVFGEVEVKCFEFLINLREAQLD